jgi:hypothetical protein
MRIRITKQCRIEGLKFDNKLPQGVRAVGGEHELEKGTVIDVDVDTARAMMRRNTAVPEGTQYGGSVAGIRRV